MYMLTQRIERVLQELEKYIHIRRTPVEGLLYKETRENNLEEVVRDMAAWRPFSRHERWGGVDMVAWFAVKLTIPVGYDGQTAVLSIKTGREGEWYPGGPQYLVYIDGQVKHGMDLWHEQVILTENAVPGDSYDIVIQGFSGVKDILTGMEMDLSVRNRHVWDIYFDLKTAYDAAMTLPPEDKKRLDAVNCLNQAVNLLDLRKPMSRAFNESLSEARAYLRLNAYGDEKITEPYTAHCVGHTHLDIAWLWTIEDSRKKAVRTFTNTLDLMSRYPNYTFMASQPVVYEYVKTDFPQVYEQVKEKIHKNRWEPEGAMWVEPDCNIPSGESLVRQILLGKRFFQKEFGKDSKVLWLPDVFGFSGALPQILKKAGVEYFITTKLKWNEYNQIPYDLFNWRGIDGTGVLTYFTPHHAAYLGAQPCQEVWRAHKQKDIGSRILVPFGWGDAGGGATEDMLEAGDRLLIGMAGSPRVQMSGTLDFMREVEAEATKSNKLPTWVGELYFELHRGTYTSMARNKRNNRKSEFMYQDAECFGVIAGLQLGREYDREKLDTGWKKILLNQFHDILPGSSVKAVYEQSDREYGEILSNGKSILEDCFAQTARAAALETDSIIAFNGLGFTRSDIVTLPVPDGYRNPAVYDGDVPCPSQITYDGQLLLLANRVPSKGYKAFAVSEKEESAADKSFDWDYTAENCFFRLRFDSSGALISVFDKRCAREVIKQGARGNVLQVFEDLPLYANDAWDINIYYEEKMWEIDHVTRFEIIESGDVRTVIRLEKTFLDSVVIQDICMYEAIPRIDFVTTVDWKEKYLLLKAAFPVEVHANTCRYDIQFGNIERPNHWNTSWDYARFEVCGHKWADMSEAGYGVSLMNDCKYGYDVKDNQMRLTLLKSADYPNTDADREIHRFTYALYPHCGSFAEGGTTKAAYLLNCPLYAVLETPHRGALPDSYSLLSVDCDNVIIDTVKLAEDNDDIIVRLYECHNRTTRAHIRAGFHVGEAHACDLMENKLSRLQWAEDGLEILIKPYEIVSLRLTANP